MEKQEIIDIKILISEKQKINQKFFHKNINSYLPKLFILIIIITIAADYWKFNITDITNIMIIIIFSQILLLIYMFFIYPIVLSFKLKMKFLESFQDFYIKKQKINLEINNIYIKKIESNYFFRKKTISKLKEELENKIINEINKKKNLSELIWENRIRIFMGAVILSLLDNYHSSLFEINSAGNPDEGVKNSLLLVLMGYLIIYGLIILLIIFLIFINKKNFYDYNIEDNIDMLYEIKKYLSTKEEELEYREKQLNKDKLKEEFENKESLINYLSVDDIRITKKFQKEKIKKYLKNLIISEIVKEFYSISKINKFKIYVEIKNYLREDGSLKEGFLTIGEKEKLEKFIILKNINISWKLSDKDLEVIEYDMQKIYRISSIDFEISDESIEILKNEIKKEIFVDLGKSSWKIVNKIEYEKYKNLEEKKINKIFKKNFIGILILIGIIILTIGGFFLWFKTKSRIEVLNYVLNNVTDEKFTIKIHSTKINLPPNSVQNINFNFKDKKNKYEIEIITKDNEYMKCNVPTISVSEVGIITLNKKTCPLFVKIENKKMINYSNEHEYKLINSTDEDIDIQLNENYYKLKSKSMSVVNLENKNYKLTNNCNLDIKYNSKSGVVNINKDKCTITYY